MEKIYMGGSSDYTDIMPLDTRNYKVPREMDRAMKAVAKKLNSYGAGEFQAVELEAPALHLLKAPGKMLRPGLVFLGSAYVGIEDFEEYVDLAAALELLHVSSLIHDDIIDKDVVRRGLETVHLKYGIENAILAGDALISMAIQESSRYGSEVVSTIAESAMQMCAGEVIDHRYQRNSIIPGLDGYLNVARLKSSGLIATATSIVALHKSDKRAKELYNFGFNLGTAFQIRDDILDFLNIESGAGRVERFGYKLNVIKCLKEEGSLETEDALRKAGELNSRYIKKAIAELGKNKYSKLFEDYAMSMETNVQDMEFPIGKR